MPPARVPPEVYVARPTVRVDQRSYALVNELLLGMRMTESEGGMSSLELRFSNWASDTQGGAGLAFEDNAILALGKGIVIYAGDERNPGEIFRGLITALDADFPRSGPPELTVLAEDVLHRLRTERRSRRYEQVTIESIAQQLAQEAGLQANVDDLGDTAEDYTQLNESDLAFLRRLLARYGADVQVVGEELQISPRQAVRRGLVPLQLHAALRSARVLADLADQVTTVTVSGWESAGGVPITASSGRADLGPGSGRSGVDVLRGTLGERPLHLGHLATASSGEATQIADNTLSQRARRFLTVEATTEGNAQLRVGTHVELTGLGPRFSNTYYVTRVCHRYDLVNGYETDFSGECAFLGGAS